MLWTHLYLSLEHKNIRSKLRDIGSLYQQWGWEAISLIQRYSTRYFALLAQIAHHYTLKPIYAVEILTHAPGGKKAFPAIAIAKTQKGIQCLYEIVSHTVLHHKRVVSSFCLEQYKTEIYLLIGEELEDPNETYATKAITYYTNTWQNNWWTLCAYTETKPIENLRTLTQRVKQYSLRTVAIVPQRQLESLWSYQQVLHIFRNHPEFVEEVSNLLSSLPHLLPYESPQKTSLSTFCTENVSQISWINSVTLSILKVLLRYKKPFFLHTAPIDIKGWFHEQKRKGHLFQSILFHIHPKKVTLYLSKEVFHHILRWLLYHYPYQVGCIHAREDMYTILIIPGDIKKSFAISGEIEKIPLIQTTEDIVSQGDMILLRLETHWIWDIFDHLHQQGITLKHYFPLTLHWTDHPLFIDMHFFYQRRHVISHEGQLLREISRAIHPFLKGPFLYKEEALVYLSRFIPKQKAKEFLLLLQRDDPTWVKEKQLIEQSLPQEELHSLYWSSLLKEGKYLLSRRQERLRWYGLALFCSLIQRYPLECTVAALNCFHQTKQKNRLILYARLVWKIEFLAPSLSQSQLKDTIEHGKIRLGLRHLNTFPLAMKKLIVTNQPYRNFFDFLQKHPYTSTKNLLQWLKMGLFDDMEPENSAKMTFLTERKDNASPFLFNPESLWDANPFVLDPYSLPKINVLELYGLYIHDHPLDRYKTALATFHRSHLKECENLGYGTYVACIVHIHRYRHSTIYEIVDETAWKQVFFEGEPPFPQELYRPYIWKIVVQNKKLEVLEVFPFEHKD